MARISGIVAIRWTELVTLYAKIQEVKIQASATLACIKVRLISN